MNNNQILKAARERSIRHMTLGALIKKLKPHKDKGLIVRLGAPHSYRGYYTDLSFEAVETPLDDLLVLAQKCIGETFSGYRGGTYLMHKNTPLWVAVNGDCGEALMDIVVDDAGVDVITKHV